MRPPRRLLIPTDYSEPSLRAIEYGLGLAGQLGASITVLHAYGEKAEAPYSVDQREHAERLDKLLRRYKSSSVEIVGLVRWAVPSDGINHVAAEIDADLVVMGTHGRHGMQRALLGSVAESVLRDSTRPIVTIPPAQGAAFHRGLPARILVAVDFDETSEAAVDYAVDLASLIGASLTVLHARAGAAARARLEQTAAERRGRGAKIDIALRADEPVRAINDVAAALEAGLIVLGTRGRRGLARAFGGSVAEAVIRGASRPVLALRAAV